MTDSKLPRPPIRFRGRSFLALVLAPVPPIPDWLAELDALKERAPAFFTLRAVILDVSGLAFERSDLVSLLADLAARNITILGIEGIGPTSLGPGFPPPLAGGRPTEDLAAPGTEARTEAPSEAPPQAPIGIERPSAPARNLVLEAPVRSGQLIQHLEGDVTVMGSVASGAEIIAGGSIHVYGALRGRAIAGATGNPGARIYCRRFEPELLAIDGLYKTADDLDAGPDKALRGQAVQVRLDEDTIRITPLD